MISRGVQFIDGSAFQNVELLSISIERESEQNSMIDIVDHKVIRNCSNPSSVMIPRDIEILGSKCFSACRPLKCVLFESNSQLMRIESNPVSDSSLRSIVIAPNIEIRCSECFF
jgi:hypothetical protein